MSEHHLPNNCRYEVQTLPRTSDVITCNVDGTPLMDSYDRTDNTSSYISYYIILYPMHFQLLQVDDLSPPHHLVDTLSMISSLSWIWSTSASLVSGQHIALRKNEDIFPMLLLPNTKQRPIAFPKLRNQLWMYYWKIITIK